MFRRGEEVEKKNTQPPTSSAGSCVCVSVRIQCLFDCDGEQLCGSVCVARLGKNSAVRLVLILFLYHSFSLSSWFSLAPIAVFSPLHRVVARQLSRCNGNTDTRSDSAGCSHLSRFTTTAAQRAQRSQLQSGELNSTLKLTIRFKILTSFPILSFFS